MARKSNSEDTAKTKTGAKATPAGRIARTSPTRPSAKAKAAGKAADQASDPATPAARRAHLRPVETPATPPADPHVEEAEAGGGGKSGAFKRQDLLEAIVARSGGKRPEVKLMLDVVLDELARAIDTHSELALAPLGKLSVKRRKPDGGGPDILTIKLRRSREAGAEGAETPLAAAREDG